MGFLFSFLMVIALSHGVYYNSLKNIWGITMSTASREPTSKFLSRLLRTKRVGDFIKDNESGMEERDFAEYLRDICEAKGFTVREQVISRAELESSFGHSIFRGVHVPSRDKTIQLAFGLGLNLEETQALLRQAKHSALYPRLKRDVVIIFCIDKQKTLLETQTMLFENGQETFDFGEKRHGKK